MRNRRDATDGVLIQTWEKKMFRRTYLAMTAAALMAGPAFAGSMSKDIVDTTVFAPTDEAFAALPAGTVEDLLKPENKDTLVAILTYHVVAGKVMSGDLSNDMSATTVQGGDVKIMTEGGVTVNGANVVTADIEASNGVIHVIDAVILPE
jgi:uncharacterized surface protein with fasciclin (FAS1) repeats